MLPLDGHHPWNAVLFRQYFFGRLLEWLIDAVCGLLSTSYMVYSFDLQRGIYHRFRAHLRGWIMNW